MSIQKKILQYFELDQQKKQLDVLMKPLNAEIKEYMRNNKLDKETVLDVVATFTVQERVDTNQEKMVNKLEILGFNDAITVVKIPNQAAVEELIYDGKLEAQELSDCLTVKLVEVLKISKAKKAKN